MAATPIDVLIRNAQLVDGSGAPRIAADLAIRGERILDIAPPGQIPQEAGGEIVDATGMIVCPGFIDILSHSHTSLMYDACDLSKITQGVTSEITGESWTPAPSGGRIADPFAGYVGQSREELRFWIEQSRQWSRLGDWLNALVRRGVSPNVGSFLGGGTLREYARGMQMGTPTVDELATMRRVMAEAMEDGACGVSYALIYPPDAYTSTDELVEVARVVARYGGIYATHISSESNDLLNALDEAIEIGQRAGLPVEIYHLKASGRHNWPLMAPAIERIQAAREAGLDITADMYPYAASGTGLDSVLPPWIAEGGTYFATLADPEVQQRARAETLAAGGGWEAMGNHVGPQGIMPVGFQQQANRQYAGKRLTEIAELRGQHWLESVIDLLLSEGQRIFTIYFSMDEANVTLGLRQPWVTISTDAGGLDPAWARDEGPTHPRAYGTYPRVLATYVRREQVLTLEDAVRKMSGAVAARLGLRARGLLRPGYFADVVIFDPATVTDHATFEDPHQLSTGIRDVWVNGVRVVNAGSHTGALPGKFIGPQER